MQSEADGQTLIDAFFAALERRYLGECETLLAQLRALSVMLPSYASWCDYLEGILFNERDHDWAAAERIFSRLSQTNLDLSLRGRVLLALGRTYDYQGRWVEAIHAYEQSLPVFAALNQSIDQAKSWKQMAITYRRGFSRGDFGSDALQQAIEHCKNALDVLAPIADPAKSIVWLKGTLWNTLGLIYRCLGQWDTAINCYQQDLDICRLLNDRFGLGLSYGNLGEVYQKRGRDDWPDALAAYQQALSIIREFDNRFHEAEALANLAFLYQEMGESEPALEYYRQAINLIEGLRAGVSDEASRAGFFATVADTYANAALLCLEAGRVEQAFNYVERARSRAFLDVLAAHSPDLSERMEAPTMTLAEVQAALPEDMLLIEYFTTGLVEAREGRAAPGVQRHRFPTARILIFAVTCDTVQAHDGGISPNDLRPSQLDSAVERHFLLPSIRRTLYDHLITPVEPLLRGKRRLYLAPHGPLHYVPFQALLSPDGRPLLHEDGPQLVYTPSASMLFRSRRTGYSQAPHSCLALGYNGSDASRLRFAEEEACSIATLTDGHAIIGSAPKRTLLYERAIDYRLLHLSCHGVFDPDSPLGSSLHLAPGEDLTALDVLEHLRLHCDLVTLSACESGLSRVLRGDELVGFVRAFIYAGAPALVCTLWRVDECSTRLLMERFYQEVQGGAGFAEALKCAQIYLMSVTRKQAHEALVRAMVDQIIHPIPPAEAGRQLASRTTSAASWTMAYPKSGCATTDEYDGILPSGPDDERVFADPYYWAPFILIGDYGSE